MHRPIALGSPYAAIAWILRNRCSIARRRRLAAEAADEAAARWTLPPCWVRCCWRPRPCEGNLTNEPDTAVWAVFVPSASKVIAFMTHVAKEKIHVMPACVTQTPGTNPRNLPHHARRALVLLFENLVRKG